MGLLPALGLLYLAARAAASVADDASPECAAWARAGKCVAHPSETRALCPASCVRELRDEYDDCGHWADNGECAKNPAMMHGRCAPSCGHQWLWSPHVRASLGMAPLAETAAVEASEQCQRESPHRAACRSMLTGLRGLLGGHPQPRTAAVTSAAAPSAPLNDIGLAESMLYALRACGRAADAAADAPSRASLNATLADAQALFQSPPSLLPELLGRAVGATRSLLESCEAETEASSAEAPAKAAGVFVAKAVPLGKENAAMMPAVGFGTCWLEAGDDVYDATLAALRAGFRHVDEAAAYGHEADVGRAIRDSGVPRAELFIVSKLSAGTPDDFSPVRVRESFERSLAALGVEYLDLYMIHGPLDATPSTAALRRAAWETMEEYHLGHRARALGVSNYDAHALRDLLSYAAVPPHVLQNKLSVYRRGAQLAGGARADGDDVLAVAAEAGVAVVGYSTLSAWPFSAVPLNDAYVARVAEGAGSTPALVLLQWAIRRGGGGVLFRSRDPAHISMAARLDGSPLLSEESMRLLDGIEALVQGTHHRPPITAPDPFGVANEDRALAAPARGGGTAGRGYVADHEARDVVTDHEARDVVTVQCATTAGALTMAVHRDWAPHGAQRFLAMVQGGFFDTHVPLFRCVDRFICQTGIAGDPRVHRNWQRKGRIPDDPPRLNMATSRPFKRGMVSFAGGGTDSRGTEFFFALDDIDLGGAAWEVPFAAVVGHESFATLGRWHRGYGEIAAFGGRAPDQQMMYRKGVEYTRAGFPDLDYITRCDVV